MKSIQIDYKPTPKQLIFHTTDADEVLYGGAAGGGKTKALVMDALARTLLHPNTSAYIFRRTFDELEKSDITEALRSYPKEIYNYTKNDHKMQLFNGSRIFFCHCAQANDMHHYQGAEIQFLYVDELTHFEERQYDFLRSRLRATKDQNVIPVSRCASNPGNIGHGWVKNRFVDAGPYMSKIKQEIFSETLNSKKIITSQYIPALVTDNPFITQDYVFELERKPEALRNALLYGHWDAFEGQVFAEFKDDPVHYKDGKFTHVIEPFEIPPYWRRYFGFDFGYTKPFACLWFAVSPQGVVYLYREWYGWNGKADTGMQITARQIAEGIIEHEREEIKNNIKVFRIADPSIFDASRGNSISQQMEPFNMMNGSMGKGVYFEPGDNDRLGGLAQVHERLRFDSKGQPMLQIFNTCKQTIRTLPALPYDDRKTEDINTHAEDHCLSGDTLVLTDKGYSAIKDLCDTMGYVRSYDGELHRYFDCRKTQSNVDTYTIYTDNGKKVTATANHRFLLKDGTWKRLDELQIGDELWEYDDESKRNKRNKARIRWRCLLQAMKVTKIEYSGKQDVFNMEVEGIHSFIVNNGIVAHNCYDALRYVLMACPMATVVKHKARGLTFDPYAWDMKG